MANEFRIKNGAISPNIEVTDTTVSTSTATGALQVAGGAGIVGNVYAGAFYGPGTGLTAIPGANVSGAVPSATSATTAGTVTTNAQPNITSVGTLTSLTSSGQIQINASNGKIALVTTNGGEFRLGLEDGNASTPMISFKTGNMGFTTVRLIASGGNVPFGRGNLEILSANTTFTSGNVYASAFYGAATGLTSIPGANVTGSVPSATSAGTVTTNAQPNITSVGTLTSLTSSGIVSVTDTTPSTSTATGSLKTSGGIGVAGNVYAGAFYGAATGLTSIPGANVSGAVPSATIASTVTTNAQPNITSVGSTLSVASSLLIGRIDNTASTPTIEFNSGATSVDYDARILCSGGNGANDGGDLAVTASTFYIGAKFGYRTGMGLSVTQLTSRTTSVTINAPVGRITLVSATTTAGQISSFTVNNSYINSTDVVMFSKFSGSGYYIISTRSLAVGSFVVDVYTPVAVTSAEAPAFNFAIIRGTLS